MQNSKKAVVYATIAVLSWSTVATAFKKALTYYSHYEMLVVASSTALVFFSVALILQNKWKLLKHLKRKQIVRFALIGLLNPVLYYLVLFKAYSLLPAQIAQPINYFWPIILLVLLSLFAHRPIPHKKFIGMALSLSGVICISAGSETISGLHLSTYGILLDLSSAFLWALFWIVTNSRKDTDGTVSFFLNFLFGTFYLLLGCLFLPVHFHSTEGIVSSIYVGMFEMGIPFLFFNLALRKSDNPSIINQMCYLSPFISLFIIHAFLGEKIFFSTYIGLFLIIIGILFNEYFVKSPK